MAIAAAAVVVVLVILVQSVLNTATLPLVKSEQAIESLVHYLGIGGRDDLSQEDQADGAQVLKCALAPLPEAAGAVASGESSAVLEAVDDWVVPAVAAVPAETDVPMAWAWILYRLANTPNPAAPTTTVSPDAPSSSPQPSAKPLMASLPEFALAYTGGTLPQAGGVAPTAAGSATDQWVVPIALHTLAPHPRIDYQRVIPAASVGMQLLVKQKKIHLVDDDIAELSLLLTQSCIDDDSATTPAG